MSSTSALAKTGVELSRLGIGGHTFALRYGGIDRAERPELLQIVELAIGEGINLFDVTQDEERRTFGSVIAELGVGDRIFLSCWLARKRTSTSEEVFREAERALDLLGVDQADLMYLDWTCTREQVEAMMELRRRGLTRFIGLLGLETALEGSQGGLEEMDVVLVNHNFYLREKEGDIRRLIARYPGLLVISLEPLGRGRFAIDRAPKGVSMAGACLKYALAFEPVHAVLVAARNLAQLRENIEIWKGNWQLSDQERAALQAGRGYEIPRPE
jgi:aryl-alcohol dehydrogenase-like predicted oxidoreductase